MSAAKFSHPPCPGQKIAARNKELRSLIHQSPASRSTFDLAATALAAVGRAEGTSKTYAREMSRLAKFASTYGFPAISGPAEISTFLSNESHVAAYVGYLANCGFTFSTTHKILFSLRAATPPWGSRSPRISPVSSSSPSRVMNWSSFPHLPDQ
jgi:hypothetical protein